MYIRRKVFSLLETEEGQEKYFSTTEFDYNAEEKTFAEKEENKTVKEESKKGWSKKKKAAVATAATTASLAAGITGAKYAGKALKNASKVKFGENPAGLSPSAYKKALRMEKVGDALQKPADKIVAASRWAGDKAKGNYEKASKAVKGVFKAKKVAEK